MYSQIFDEINSVTLDKRTHHKDLIFASLADALKHKSKFVGLASAQSAKFGDYVTIRLDDTHRIIINGADHAAVRKEFLGDETEYEINLAFKAAEFHGYMHFTHIATGLNQAIGASVFMPGAHAGTWIVRSDNIYDEKYFRGTDINTSPKLHKGSFAVEFLITDKQFLDIALKMHKKHKDIPPDNQDFLFTGNNCHNYTYKVYEDLGFAGHYLHFAQAQHLDFNDMGVFWKFKLAYPSEKVYLGILLKLIWDNPSTHIPTLLNALPYGSWGFLKIFNFGKAIVDSAAWNYYYYRCSGTSELANKQDEYGNNALHKAILMSDFKAADTYLQMEVSSNIPNVRGETALHLAAGLPPSPAKMLLLKKLIEKTTNINETDLYGDNIPLTFAIMADDPEAITLLVSNGADVRFINGTKDSLGNICVEAGKVEAAKTLFAIAPDIFYYDNGTRQIPIHHDNMKGLLPLPEDAPSAKDPITEHNIIEDIYNYFQPLIGALNPNINSDEFC